MSSGSASVDETTVSGMLRMRVAQFSSSPIVKGATPKMLTQQLKALEGQLAGATVLRVRATGDGVVEFAGKDMADLVPLTGVPFPKTPPFRLEGKAYEVADGDIINFRHAT